MKPCSNKNCKTKGEMLPPEEFYKRARSKDGLDSRCKVCSIQSTKTCRGKQEKMSYEWESMFIGQDVKYYF